MKRTFAFHPLRFRAQKKLLATVSEAMQNGRAAARPCWACLLDNNSVEQIYAHPSQLYPFQNTRALLDRQSLTCSHTASLADISLSRRPFTDRSTVFFRRLLLFLVPLDCSSNYAFNSLSVCLQCCHVRRVVRSASAFASSTTHRLFGIRSSPISTQNLPNWGST